MRKEIRNKLKAFDFHDGKIVHINLDCTLAVMLFKHWQEDIFKITFRGIVGFEHSNFPVIQRWSYEQNHHSMINVLKVSRPQKES